MVFDENELKGHNAQPIVDFATCEIAMFSAVVEVPKSVPSEIAFVIIGGVVTRAASPLPAPTPKLPLNWVPHTKYGLEVAVFPPTPGTTTTLLARVKAEGRLHEVTCHMPTEVPFFSPTTFNAKNLRGYCYVSVKIKEGVGARLELAIEDLDDASAVVSKTISILRAAIN